MCSGFLDGEGRAISATEWTEDGPRPVPIGQLAGAALALPLVVLAQRGRDTGARRGRSRALQLALEPQQSQSHCGPRVQRQKIPKA